MLQVKLQVKSLLSWKVYKGWGGQGFSVRVMGPWLIQHWQSGRYVVALHVEFPPLFKE